MKVHVGEESAIGAGLDVGGSESSAVPFDGGVVVSEVEGVGTPIDVWVDVSEPGFPKNEVVFF